jgi:spermidine synthase
MQLLKDLAWYCASPSRIRRAVRRILSAPKPVAEVDSPISGTIRVLDRGIERELFIGDTCNSVFINVESGAQLGDAYYNHLHRSPFLSVANPSVLMCGLGGGVALHIISKQLKPRSSTVIELDPAIIEVAHDYFMLGVLNVEVLLGAAAEQVAALTAANRYFDLIIEDAELLPVHDNVSLALDRFTKLSSILSDNGTIAMNAPYSSANGRNRIDNFSKQLMQRDFEVVENLVHGRWATNCIIYSRRKQKR